jgi:hypothetical protein
MRNMQDRQSLGGDLILKPPECKVEALPINLWILGENQRKQKKERKEKRKTGERNQ